MNYKKKHNIMLSTYLAVNLYNSKKWIMGVCSSSNESMLQLQYPYQLIVNHPVFLPTISRKNFSPQNPELQKITNSTKRQQQRDLQGKLRKQIFTSSQYHSWPTSIARDLRILIILSDLLWKQLATLHISPSHYFPQVSSTLGLIIPK